MPRLTPTLLLLLLAFRSLSAAETTATALEFTHLDLLDGRKLRNVVVKSYDEKTGRVLLVADKKALTVSVELVPAPFSELLRKGAPPSGATVSFANTVLPPGTPPSSSSAPLRVYLTDPTATPSPIMPTIDFAGHTLAATDRARRYYQTELRPGSVPSFTRLHQLQLNPPEPIAGWSHRYRCVGTAEIEHFTANCRSLGRLFSTFEVITEQKPGEPVQVLDFTRKT